MIAESTRPAHLLFWFGLCTFVIACSAGSLIFSHFGYSIGISSGYLSVLSIIFGAAGWLYNRKRKLHNAQVDWIGVLASLVILLASDFLMRQTNCFQFESLALTLAVLFPISLLVVRFPMLMYFVLAGTIVSALMQFYTVSGGRILFSDDHPSFLYRIAQLKHNFPLIPFYNPLWNGGVEAREFFPSGVLGFFVLWAPVWYLFDPTAVYNTIFSATLFIVLPLSVFVAARLVHVPSIGAACAASLSLLSSLFWYRWSLKYGTVGFVTSSIFFPLALSAGARFFTQAGNKSGSYAALTAGSLSLVLFWPLGLVVIAPLAIFFLIHSKSILRQWSGRLFLLGMVLIHAPWMTLFGQASAVFQLLFEGIHPGGELAKKTVTSALTDGFSWLSVLKQFRIDAASAHPLILVLALPGFFCMKQGPARRLYAVSAIWLVMLGAGVSATYPTLELDRSLIILFLLLCVPCGAGMSSLLEWARYRGNSLAAWVRAGPASTAIALILVIPFALSRIVNGKTVEQYTFATSVVSELSNAIATHAGDGRTMFAGFILHELSGGHIAPLAEWTVKPLIASRYQHDRWSYIDIIPESFRNRGREGIYEFLDLYNVSAVVTHDKLWRTWFEKESYGFQKVWSHKPFNLFMRQNFSPSYFYSGAGHIIAQNSHQVRFTLSQPDAVLKFNYLPFLFADGCEISPQQLSPDVKFVRLTACPVGKELYLRMASPISRLIPSAASSTQRMGER